MPGDGDGEEPEEKEFKGDEGNDVVEPTENAHVQNVVSAFVAENKTWEEMGLDEGLLSNVIDTLGGKPSKIQAYAIRLIAEKNEKDDKFLDVMAGAPTGSGKTGAFAIGSILRIDRETPAT